MEVVKYNNKLYLAVVVNNHESSGSCAYDREVSFYDYQGLLKLKDKTISKVKLDKLLVFTERIQGVTLPYEAVENRAPVNLKKVERYKIEVAQENNKTNWVFPKKGEK